MPKKKKTKQRNREIDISVIIKNHFLVPEHTKATEQEVKELISRYGNINNFPKILITDPAIRHLDVKPGDIIKIKRTYDIEDEYYYYRVVTDVQ